MRQQEKPVHGAEGTEGYDRRDEYKGIEKYEKINANTAEEAKEQVKKYFGKEKAWFYAVLDFAVGFGIYEDGRFSVCLGEQGKLVPVEWKYIQELRIFNRNGELRLVLLKGGWGGRYRGCTSDNDQIVEKPEEYCIDEHQKLWGKVKHEEDVNKLNWSLLSSDRGTKIWVPIELNEQQEAALLVRRFMRIPTAEYHELVYQTDMRIVDFVCWKEETSEGGERENG